MNFSNNTFRSERFGTVGDDASVVADWNSDGKTDSAVCGAGVFDVLRSNGNQEQGIRFGAANDVPVASAFVQ